MRAHGTRVVLVAAALVLAAAGCGGDEAGTAPEAGPTSTPARQAAAVSDPCSLATADEVGKIFNRPVTKVEATDVMAVQCTYRFDKGPLDVVAVGLHPEITERAAIEATLPAPANDHLVPGVGDVAFRNNTGAATGLVVLKGTVCFTVADLGRGTDDVSPEERALAELIVGRV